MNEHRAVIEAGPGTIRRLCCSATSVVDSEAIVAALEAIDDRVVLVGERPVPVDSLWKDALRSVICASSNGVTVVHPSWWSPKRIGVVTAAAAAVADDVRTHPRSWLLRQVSGCEAAAVVEIAERLVAIAGSEVVAVPRCAQTPFPAEEVAVALTGMAAEAVLIDVRDTDAGAPAIATEIAAALRSAGQQVPKIVEIDDVRLVRLARSASSSSQSGPRSVAPASGARSRGRTSRLAGRGLGAAAIVLAAATPAVMAQGRHGADAPKQVQSMPSTFLVDGRVALAVPANWPTQRVLTGPGSARVEVTSPSDPEVALHITQSPVAGETLGGTAERLKRAIDAEPTGVFVDFNPSGTSVGRPAVTYREVRTGHHVWWTVLLDGPVRISVGCQSRPGDEDAVRAVCEQAVRSAHAIG